MKKDKRILKIILGILVLPFLNYAQNATWEKYFSFGKYNDAYSMCQTKDSSYWVANLWIENLTFSNEGSSLLKLDKNGNLIFRKEFMDLGIPFVSKCSDNGVLFLQNLSKNIDTNKVIIDTLFKIDKLGKLQWKSTFPYSDPASAISEVSQGKIIVYSVQTINLFDSNGQKLWTKIDTNNRIIYQSFTDTTLIFTKETDNNELAEIEYDYNGNIIKETPLFDLKKLSNSILFTNLKTKDGAYLIIDNDNNIVYKIKNGSVIWKRILPQNIKDKYYFYIFNAIIDENNNLVFTASENTNGITLNNVKTLMFIIGENGKIKSLQRLNGELYNDLTGLIETNDGHYAACGIYQGVFDWENDNSRATLRVVKTKLNDFSNVVSGKVILDADFDCEIDSGEINLKNLIIKAESQNPDNSFCYSQGNGFYQVFTKEDSLRLKVISNSPYMMQTCTADVTFDANNVIVQKDLFVEKVIDCSYLTVDVGSRAFRPCFDAVLPVNFCNHGTATAQNAYIEVQLDPNLTFQSSSLASQSLGNNKFRFALGNIPVDSCGQFVIKTKVACDNSLLGKTLCNKAHIFPDSICGNQDQGKIKVNGVCNGTQIEFSIKNESDKAMPSAKNYLVIEDDVMYMQGNFNLNPNEVKPIQVVAKAGKTYRLIAEQTNPIYGSLATTAFENCNVSASPSTGFINQFAQGDDSPFEDIDCRVVTASYDPNDKQAVPQGVQNQHYIAKNTDIEYMIRFQNKGTDTAFTVIIKDTLSQYLDPATIVPGASSHPYRFDLTDKGIAKFIFANIQLPHQKVNDEGSNGFVKFRIKQQRDLPNGNVIKNKAAIYFDFNDPIITNETFHTIGENWLMIIPIKEVNKEAIEVKIYPNPFSQSTTIELDGEYNNLTFNVFDVNGRLLRSETFNGNRLNFERNGLDGGMYIYEILNNNKALQKGKIVIF